MKEQKKLNRRNLTSNIGDLYPEAPSPKGGWKGFTQAQVDRYYIEQDEQTAKKRTRRTMHQSGRFCLNKLFI